MAALSSVLVWKIPWTEKPGRLQSMGSQWIRHDWVTEHACTYPHKNNNCARMTKVVKKKKKNWTMPQLNTRSRKGIRNWKHKNKTLYFPLIITKPCDHPISTIHENLLYFSIFTETFPMVVYMCLLLHSAYSPNNLFSLYPSKSDI